jgi:hypothetical protein
LEEWLRQKASCHTFQQRIAGVQRTPWLMATNEDARIPGVHGAQLNAFDRAIQNYMNEVQWLAADSKVAFATLMEVSNLVEPPIKLFKPGIAIPVFWRWLRGEKVVPQRGGK